MEQSAGKQGTGIGARSPAYGGRMMRSAPHGESLSLRQRTPAMLLRKLDEFEEKAHRIWAKAEAEEENRKVWSSSHVRGSGVNTAAGASSSSSSLIGISAPLPRGPQLDPPIKKPLLVVAQPGMNKEDPAPPTQQQQQQQQPTTPLVVKKTEESSNNRILIPTKTGREPPKKLYPKESPPLFSGGSAGGARFVPVVGVSGSQMGLLATSGGLHHHHHQPHSLPLYPVQLGWSRYPPAPGSSSGVGDVVAPMSQLDVWKYAAAVQESWRPAAVVVPSGSSGGGSSTIGISSGGERSRSRDRSRGGGNIVDPKIPPPTSGKIDTKGLAPGKVIYGEGLTFKGGTHGSTLEIIPKDAAKDLKLPVVPKSPSNHYLNFVRACRGEEVCRSRFEISGPLSQVMALGVLAQRVNAKLEFDPVKKRITNHKLANELLNGVPPRSGWEQYYKL